jgi:pantothenate synthetase
MGHACTHEHFRGPDKEHPVIAILAVIAIVAAILLIGLARVAVHGTEDLQQALVDPVVSDLVVVPPAPDTIPQVEREVDAAVTSSRFATGFSP